MGGKEDFMDEKKSLDEKKHRADEVKSNEIKSISDESKIAKDERSRKITRASFPLLCLPCVPFPIYNSMRKEKSSTDATDNAKGLEKLYMAVTFMNHEDHQSRFLHCTFTDAPGKDE